LRSIRARCDLFIDGGPNAATRLGELQLVAGGVPLPYSEAAATAIFAQPEIDVRVELRLGGRGPPPCGRHRISATTTCASMGAERRRHSDQGATLGGTAIIGRVIQVKTGLALSQIYLFVDGTIVVAAGVIFGWEIALYAMLTLLLSGIATDYVLEGPSRTRTATIITSKPEPIIAALIQELGRGVSHWEAVGGFTGAPRTVIMCTIYRPQVTELKRIVAQADADAFVTIGMTQQALGQGVQRAAHAVRGQR
jgi:hypothetical protein